MAAILLLATAARTQALTVFGSDPCPVARADEIVVCARLPESERYRIPRRMRDSARTLQPDSVAWGARSLVLDEINRATLPGSCSVNGSYGQSGCAQAAIARWRAERAAMAAEARASD